MFANFYAQHPRLTWILGLVAGFFIVSWIWGLLTSGGSSSQVSAAQVTQAGPSPDAVLAANTQVQLANIQAAATTQQQEDQTALAAASLAVQQKLGELGYANDAQNAILNYNANVFGIASNEHISMAQLAEKGQEFNITAAVQQHSDDLNAQISQANISAQRDIETALINGQVTQAQINANTTAQLAKQTTKQQKTSGILAFLTHIF